jgi:hypothetical protein
MTVYSKQSYEDQDDGGILKAARKQQYIMFPDPIAFLKDEIKAELGMKSKMLNYARSRNPSCACAHTHRQIQPPREPPN